MTPDELTTILDDIGWHVETFAYKLNDVHGYSNSDIAALISGQQPIPDHVEIWLEDVAEALDEVRRKFRPV